MYVCMYGMCARARAYMCCVVQCVFYIQNKLCRFETQIRREVPSRELSEMLRCGISFVCDNQMENRNPRVQGLLVFPWSVSRGLGETHVRLYVFHILLRTLARLFAALQTRPRRSSATNRLLHRTIP